MTFSLILSIFNLCLFLCSTWGIKPCKDTLEAHTFTNTQAAKDIVTTFKYKKSCWIILLWQASNKWHVKDWSVNAWVMSGLAVFVFGQSIMNVLSLSSHSFLSAFQRIIAQYSHLNQCMHLHITSIRGAYFYPLYNVCDYALCTLLQVFTSEELRLINYYPRGSVSVFKSLRSLQLDFCMLAVN